MLWLINYHGAIICRWQLLFMNCDPLKNTQLLSFFNGRTPLATIVQPLILVYGQNRSQWSTMVTTFHDAPGHTYNYTYVYIYTHIQQTFFQGYIRKAKTHTLKNKRVRKWKNETVRVGTFFGPFFFGFHIISGVPQKYLLPISSFLHHGSHRWMLGSKRSRCPYQQLPGILVPGSPVRCHRFDG